MKTFIKILHLRGMKLAGPSETFPSRDQSYSHPVSYQNRLIRKLSTLSLGVTGSWSLIWYLTINILCWTNQCNIMYRFSGLLCPRKTSWLCGSQEDTDPLLLPRGSHSVMVCTLLRPSSISPVAQGTSGGGGAACPLTHAHRLLLGPGPEEANRLCSYHPTDTGPRNNESG